MRGNAALGVASHSRRAISWSRASCRGCFDAPGEVDTAVGSDRQKAALLGALPWFICMIMFEKTGIEDGFVERSVAPASANEAGSSRPR